MHLTRPRPWSLLRGGREAPTTGTWTTAPHASPYIRIPSPSQPIQRIPPVFRPAAVTKAAVQPAVKSAQVSIDSDNWRAAFANALDAQQALDAEPVEVTFRGKISPSLEWRSVVVRAVDLKKAGRQLQFSYFGAKQNIVKNAQFNSQDAQQRLDQLLHQLPFSSVTLKSKSEVVSVQITKAGKAIVHQTTSTTSPSPTSAATGAGTPGSGANPTTVGTPSTSGPISLAHDRRKGLPIPPDVPHPFLQRIGMQTADGRIKADMVDKMAQVNDFLKLLGHTGVLTRLQQERGDQPLTLLDCGCGSSHLTFGTWHYVNNVLGIPAHIRGVDSNTALMERSNKYSRELGLTPEQAMFTAAYIGNYAPDARPDVVLALHACDTATDEALALGVKQGAPLVLAVPCCHQHLHKQLSGARGLTISPLQPIMGQGISKQRLLDIVTDTLRAQLLRVLGYKTDVVEFVSTEHTPRNTLIRAVLQPDTRAAARSAPTTDQALEAAIAAAPEQQLLQQGTQVPGGSVGHRPQQHMHAQAALPSHAHHGDSPEQLSRAGGIDTAPSASESHGHGSDRAGSGAPSVWSGRSRQSTQRFWDEYVALKAFFGGVTPKLETLLQAELSALGFLIHQ